MEQKKQPIPDLNETISTAVDIVKRFSVNTNSKRAELIFNLYRDFIAKRLHRLLCKDATLTSRQSEGFSHLLLGRRESLMEGSTYHVSFQHKGNSAIDRASYFILSLLNIRRDLRSDSFLPDIERDLSLDMSLYQNIFHCCRTPFKNADLLLNYDVKPYLIISIRGLHYSIEFPSSHTVNLLDIKYTLGQIICHASRINEQQLPIGSLTALPRKKWFEYRKKLLKNDALIIQKIEKAMCLICLDMEDCPEESAGISKWLFNNTHNRWFDKSLQIVVFKNGEAGMLAEHAALDGTILARLGNELYTKEESGIICETNCHGLTWEALKWSTYSKVFHQKLQYTLLKTRNHHTKSQIVDFPLSVYGISFFKKRGFSPDASVQLILQNALFKLFGEEFSFVEAVNLRHFYNGRLCITFTHTNEVREFILFNGDDQKQKYELFKQAIRSIKDVITHSKNGFCPSTHFWAMNSLSCNSRSLTKSIRLFREKNNFFAKLDRRIHLFTYPRIVTSNAGAIEGIKYFSTVTSAEMNSIAVGYLIFDECIHFSLKVKGNYIPLMKTFQDRILESATTLKDFLVNSDLNDSGDE